MNPHRSLTAFAIAAVIAVALCAPADAIALTGPTPGMQDPAAPGNAERTLFTQGQHLYLQGSYTTAAEVLEKFLITYPNSILTDLTLLWLGRSYFQLGRFSEAEEVGKRLRTIKDTPFADIYDNELKAALREAAQRPGTSIPERVAPVAQPQVSVPSVPKPGRERYANTQTSRPRTSPATVNKKTPTPAQRSAAQRAVTRSGKPAVARNSDNKIARQPAKATSTTRRPSSSSGQVVRSGAPSGPRRDVSAANNPPQRAKPTPGARTSTAALRGSSPSRQTIAAKSKPGSLTRKPGRASTSNSRSAAPAPTISNRERRQTTSTRALSNNQRNVSSPGNRRASSNTARPQRSAQVSPKLSADANDSRPMSVSGPAVTGGLYSMVDTAMATPPVNLEANKSAAPASVAPESRVDARSRGMNAKPGETIYLSFVVRNYGSIRQTYELRITSPGAPEAQLFVDSNGDGLHQSDELRVTGSPVIELKNSEVPFLLEVKVPRTAFEGQQYFYTVTVLAFGSGEVVAKVTSTLTVSSIRATMLPLTVPETSRSVQAR